MSSSDVWYYQCLAQVTLLKHSKHFSPHFDLSRNSFAEGLDVNQNVCQNKCVLEFSKPLLYNYNSFISKQDGFTLNELCKEISR